LRKDFYTNKGYAPHDENTVPDQVLIRQIAAGDPRALEILYQRHGLALLRYLSGQIADRAQAEEVLQDVMLAVWHTARHFRAESSVRTWLITIAHHRASNARTRRSHFDDTSIDEIERVSTDAPTLIESLIQQSEQKELYAAFNRLPAAQRETLELVFYHALSGPEAAQALGVAHGTVKSRLHRALAKLRRLLQEAEIPNS